MSGPRGDISRFLDDVRRARSEVGHIVEERLREFLANRKSEESLFSELCFCLLTANFSAEGGIRIQREVGDGFLTLPKDELVKKLRSLGHRYPEARAEYIVLARKLYGRLSSILNELSDPLRAREWLVKNVKGLGYKEASHFLRNVGCLDLAILDRHILRYMKERGFIDEIPRSLSGARYLKLERTFRAMAEKVGMKPGELDLYIWYLKTGKVLK